MRMQAFRELGAGNLAQRAASKGYARAMSKLSEMYRNGRGVPAHFKKSLEWKLAAARAGHAQSQWIVANKYWKGAGGVEKNHEEAVHWYRRAAENGYPAAMMHYADALERGIGTQQDLDEAFRWCQKAAETGGSPKVRPEAEGAKKSALSP